MTHRIRRTLAALATIAAGALPLQAAAVDVGVSIGISQPGVYGRIDIGRFPQPQVIVAQPVIVAPRPAVVVQAEPVYLWVPADHRRNWKRHCGRYQACATPVYFVQDRWYDAHVRRGPPGHHRHGPERGRGHGHGKHRD